MQKKCKMSEVKPYILPEEAPCIVEEAVAAHVSPNMGIKDLRHYVMDAVYATNDQKALYSCLMFLSNMQKTSSSLKQKMLSRLDELAKLSDGWDGEHSFHINHEVLEFVRKTITLAKEDSLKDWVLFPDSHGYLYLDYTEEKNIAGITIANNQIAAFVKRNGELAKYKYDKLDVKDILALLEEAHG